MVHNAADLPHLAWWSAEYVGPTLVWIGLLLAWWWRGGSRRASLLLFGWGIVNLAGAVTSVLPLAIWPFEPEQSARHYLFHVVYTVAQLPLVVVLWPAARGATT